MGECDIDIPGINDAMDVEYIGSCFSSKGAMAGVRGMRQWSKEEEIVGNGVVEIDEVDEDGTATPLKAGACTDLGMFVAMEPAA